MSITAEEFDDYDAEHDEGGLSGFYVLAIFLALLGAFLVIVYFAYQKGMSDATLADADLPVVAADPRPVREEVPLAIGGTERREVYDRIEGVTPTSVVADARPDRDPMEGFASAPDAARPAESETPVAAATVTAALAEPTATGPAAAKPKATSEPSAPAAATVAAAKPDPKPAAAAPIKGTHVVQVGAFGSNDEAMRFYQTLSDKMGGFVADKSPDVQVAEVKGRTYHRLRLAPFGSKSDANEYCAGLKAKGQDCLVKGV